MMAILVAVALITVGAGRVAGRALGKRVPIGDEVEHLCGAVSARPGSNALFLRVPLFPLFLWLSGRWRRESGIDAALELVAVLTVVLSTASAHVLFGPTAALVGGVVLALWPDRLALAQRLWPDTLLALFVSGLLLVLTAGPPCPWIAGAVTAFAVLTRIDALALLPVAGFYIARPGSARLEDLIALWAPVLLPLVILTVRNGLRVGLWLPDDTALFNLRLLAEEAPSAPLEPAMHRLGTSWRTEGVADRLRNTVEALRATALGPWRFLLGVGKRLYGLTGRDTFAVQKLISEDAGAFPGMSREARRSFGWALRWSFPCLLALACASLIAQHDPARRPDLALAVAVFAPAVLFTARTRYRFATLPCLAPGAGATLAGIGHAGNGWNDLATLALVFVLLFVFASAPPRAERW